MIYDAECGICRHRYEYWRPVVLSDHPTPCPHCGGAGRQIIVNVPYVAVQGKWEPFRSVLDGKTVITTERQRQHHMAEHQVMDAREIYGDVIPQAPEIKEPSPIMPDLLAAVERLKNT